MSQEIRDRIVKLATVIHEAESKLTFKSILYMKPEAIPSFIYKHVKLHMLGKATSMVDKVKGIISGYENKDEESRKKVADTLMRLIEDNKNIFRSDIDCPDTTDKMVGMLDERLGIKKKASQQGGEVEIPYRHSNNEDHPVCAKKRKKMTIERIEDEDTLDNVDMAEKKEEEQEYAEDYKDYPKKQIDD
jgi:hypothetical protein